jgi:pimeloyl-ACP methyl ester carboxylesterase
MDTFTQSLGLSRCTLYMQDYDGPVGFRIALAHPERVKALIVQDAVAPTRVLPQIGQREGRSGQTGAPTRLTNLDPDFSGYTLGNA